MGSRIAKDRNIEFTGITFQARFVFFSLSLSSCTPSVIVIKPTTSTKASIYIFMTFGHRNFSIELGCPQFKAIEIYKSIYFKRSLGLFHTLKLPLDHTTIYHTLACVNYSKCRQSPDPMHRFMLDFHTLPHSISNDRVFYACQWFLWWHETTRENERRRDNGKLRLKSCNSKINLIPHAFTRTHRRFVVLRKYLRLECLNAWQPKDIPVIV